MIDYLAAEDARLYVLVAGGVVLLLLLWLIWRRRRSRAASVGEVVRRISFDYLSHIILPNADEGEIHLDHLLLTAEGLLIIDVKNVEGIVFGSDKMQEWTVIGRDRRYTFSNPQPGMFDRIAAVRQVVRDVPVTGRILFLDGAEFKKGVPDLVCSLDELLDEFGEASDQAANAKIDAFKPHWERIRERARPAEARRSRRRAVAV